MKMLSLLFSFKGRLHRSTYWLGVTIGSFLLFPAMFIIAYDAYNWLIAELQQDQDANPFATAGKLLEYPITSSPNLFIALPFLIASLWSLLAVTAKRLHDIGLPGWPCVVWIPLTLMPGFAPFLLSIIVPIVIGCVKGTVGANKYGPDTLVS